MAALALVMAIGLFPAAVSSGGYSLAVGRGLLIAVASLAVEHGLYLGCAGFSGCGASACLSCVRWNLPGPGIEPV